MPGYCCSTHAGAEQPCTYPQAHRYLIIFLRKALLLFECFSNGLSTAPVCTSICHPRHKAALACCALCVCLSAFTCNVLTFLGPDMATNTITSSTCDQHNYEFDISRLGRDRSSAITTSPLCAPCRKAPFNADRAHPLPRAALCGRRCNRHYFFDVIL